MTDQSRKLSKLGHQSYATLFDFMIRVSDEQEDTYTSHCQQELHTNSQADFGS